MNSEVQHGLLRHLIINGFQLESLGKVASNFNENLVKLTEKLVEYEGREVEADSKCIIVLISIGILLIINMLLAIVFLLKRPNLLCSSLKV